MHDLPQLTLFPRRTLASILQEIGAAKIRLIGPLTVHPEESAMWGRVVRHAALPLWPECPPLFLVLQPYLQTLCIVGEDGFSLHQLAVDAGATALVEELDRRA